MRTVVSLCFALAMLLVAGDAVAENLSCSECGKRITGRYVKSADGRVFCSQRCFRKTLPKCAVCGKTISGRYMVADGKKYCSERCYQTILPKCEITGKPLTHYLKIKGHYYSPEFENYPRCAETGLPVVNGVKLGDGRYLTREAARRVVEDPDRLNYFYEQAQQELQRITGYRDPDPPPLNLVDANQLRTLWKQDLEDLSTLRGFYSHDTHTRITTDHRDREIARQEKVTRKVYLLTMQTPENFTSSAVHELTHNLIAQAYPKLTDSPLWFQEGLCQYTAATYCRRHNYRDALENIEKSPLPAYGDGYRFFKRKFGDNNFKAIKKWLDRLDPDTIPDRPPTG